MVSIGKGRSQNGRYKEGGSKGRRKGGIKGRNEEMKEGGWKEGGGG